MKLIRRLIAAIRARYKAWDIAEGKAEAERLRKMRDDL